MAGCRGSAAGVSFWKRFFLWVAGHRNGVRARFEKMPPAIFAAGLSVAAVLALLPCGHVPMAGVRVDLLLALGSVLLVYPAAEKRPAADILLLIFMATVWIAKLFSMWYISPYSKLYLPVLGQLMWFRTGPLFDAVYPPRPGCRIRILGRAPAEWKIGRRAFSQSSCLWPPALAWSIGIRKPLARRRLAGKKNIPAGTWILLSERCGCSRSPRNSFFSGAFFSSGWFPGTRSEWMGLIAASLLFGRGLHVFFTGSFPTGSSRLWAALAGHLFTALAFPSRPQPIRASMVTHAPGSPPPGESFF